MSTFQFPIQQLNDLVSKYGVATAAYATASARGLNTKNSITCLGAAAQIIRALYNNVPADLQSAIQYPVDGIYFNGVLKPTQIQCLFTKLVEILNETTGYIPDIFPPNYRLWDNSADDIRVDGAGNIRVWR